MYNVYVNLYIRLEDIPRYLNAHSKIKQGIGIPTVIDSYLYRQFLRVNIYSFKDLYIIVHGFTKKKKNVQRTGAVFVIVTNHNL